MADDRRRRPLPGEGDRFGTHFDSGQTGGVPEETIDLSVNAGILAPYAEELRQWAVEYRRNLERGHLQLRQMASIFLGLPHVRAVWPMTSSNEGDDVADVSGQGRTLTGNGVVTFGLSSGLLAPVSNYGLTNPNRYLSRSDENGLNWTGLDDFFVMGWVRPRGSSTTGIAPWVSKGDEGVTSEYRVTFDRSTWRLTVGVGGEDYEAPLSRAIVLDQWSFIGAGYNSGTDQFIVFIDGWYNEVSGGSPTLTATTDPFYVGRHDNSGASRWRGELGALGFYNEVPAEELIDNVFEGTRYLFGR